MDLVKVNHVITAVKGMLQNLVDNNVISGGDSANLLPVIVKHVVRHDTIEIEGL